MPQPRTAPAFAANRAERAGSLRRHRPSATVRQIRTSVETIVPAGKPTVVASIDDVVEKDRYDLEITATKID